MAKCAGPEKEQDMFEAVMERTAWGGGEMGSTPTPRPPQASARQIVTTHLCAQNHNVTLFMRYC